MPEETFLVLLNPGSVVSDSTVNCTIFLSSQYIIPLYKLLSLSSVIHGAELSLLGVLMARYLRRYLGRILRRSMQLKQFVMRCEWRLVDLESV